MDEDELPMAIASNTLNVMGVELVVHVLDNGQRVIDAASMDRFMEALDSDLPMTPEDADRIAKALRS